MKTIHELAASLRALHAARNMHFATDAGVQAFSIVATEERLADLLAAADALDAAENPSAITHEQVCEAALTKFLQKTEWVQDEHDAGQLPLSFAGMHRADIMTAEIHRLRAELEKAESTKTTDHAPIAGSRPNLLTPEQVRVESIKPSPWYPDDSGKWVEVPDELMEMPDGLKGGDLVEVLFFCERERNSYCCCFAESSGLNWYLHKNNEHRIVAYRKRSGP